MKVVRENYQNEDWVSIYQSALTELEDAKMSGRIENAHTAILARIEKLHALLARQRRNLGFDLGRYRHRDRAFLLGMLHHGAGKIIALGGRAFLDIADIEHGL